jgi:hypothetical protein
MAGSVLEEVLLPQSVLRVKLVNQTTLVVKPVPLVFTVQPVDMMTRSSAPTEPTLLAPKRTVPCAQQESIALTRQRLVSLVALEHTVREVPLHALTVLQVSNAATSLSQSHARLESMLLPKKILAVSVVSTRSVATKIPALRQLAPLQGMLMMLKVLLDVAYAQLASSAMDPLLRLLVQELTGPFMERILAPLLIMENRLTEILAGQETT